MHLHDLTQFLNELSHNNNRPWFVMNKPRYDILREEFLVTLSSLITQIAKYDPALAGCNPSKALFRIHRDMRFSHDKSPYKTRFSAAIVPNDLRRPSVAHGPCYYLQIDANGRLLCGAGEYAPAPARLRAIRAHIVNDAPGFSKLLKNRKMCDTFGQLRQESKLKRAPRGFEADAAHIESIKLKMFFVWTEEALNLAQPERLVPDLAGSLRDAAPLVNWLRSVPQPTQAPTQAQTQA